MTIQVGRLAGIQALKEWYTALSPLKVDIVGDFAGKELFAIHGEALLTHCIEEANVDFTYGFQLLHAVHAVETFLSKLEQRGCNFHVLWFDAHEDLAVPRQLPDRYRHRYLLTRTVLIEHLRSPEDSNCTAHAGSQHTNAGVPSSFVFPTIGSDEFAAYAREHCLHFIMGSSGIVPELAYNASDNSLGLVAALRLFADQGYSLAFIDDIDFRSSKVYARIVTSPTPAKRHWLAESPFRETALEDADDSGFISQLKYDTAFREYYQPRHGMNIRQDIAVIACAWALKKCPDSDTQKRVAAFVLHTAMLDCAALEQRSFSRPQTIHVEDDRFIESFSHVANMLILFWRSRGVGSSNNMEVYDLVDGRLFLHILQHLDTINLIGDTRLMAQTIEKLVGVSVLQHLPSQEVPATLSLQPKPSIPALPHLEKKKTVLPFSHPIFDSYLEEVELQPEDQVQESAACFKIFEELTHWHNQKNALDPKPVRKAVPWWDRKRNQRAMANTIAYSASLTNASGKNIDPETIVSQDAGKGSLDKNTSNNKKQQAWKANLAQRDSAKSAKSNNNGGRQRALEQVKKTQAAKNEAKVDAVVQFLRQQCRDFDTVQPQLKRYLRARKYLLGLSNVDKDIIGGETSLYVCKILSGLLGERSPASKYLSNIALLRSHVMDMCALPLTAETRKQLRYLTAALQLSMPPDASSAIPTRQLPFEANFHRSVKGIELLGRSKRQFQLEHCGPYLDRSFDSAPDPRVPFNPDAWQRRVLDAIDEDKSLFVVAPTSAGKTFISFYAMKKILQANDDDVLVYVAPTKALVNQIAAEIQARFSKSYHGGARSVWAIHTRDYRINNPTGCQILVTVPHILQIMLLAPSNAQKPTSWSRRVKRIIFDEVHCIGQAEDGIVWEQLLLLAPCPIIALSATVGNPGQFEEWLTGTQKVKGFDLEMVVHNTRYSDLRKFIYQAPEARSFGGFEPIERLPIPGLDSEGSDAGRFVFVHPLGGVNNKSKETLRDMSLEPRDCLTLWQAIVKHENASYPLDCNLDPSHALPELVRKPDITKWEAALKQQLYKWMADPASPLDNVRKDLRCSSAPRTDPKKTIQSTFDLLADLRSRGALPAIVFNYDRTGCEKILSRILKTLKDAEHEYRETNPQWQKRLERHERWLAEKSKKRPKAAKVPGRKREDEDNGTGQSKLDQLREDASEEAHPEASFDPDAPLENFSFADATKISKQELKDLISSLSYYKIKGPIIEALKRGLGIHHAGMNLRYRQVVEMLFRKGFLTAVIATGTLALGLNMPCKTVIFAGDSVFLTALTYRQASGRAGRRGFDLLGNVVLHGIPHHRAIEIMSSRLPDLIGHFPISVTLILRLFGLLHGTHQSDYAVKAVQSLLTQSRLYLGGPSSQLSIKHHLRFSIEYLRRQHLLSVNGAPINFAGLVGHLYFTENAVFAFHTLLKEGYLHNLCDDVHIVSKRKDLLLELLTVLCHLFCRIPCTRYRDEEWLKKVVHDSPSIVLLPRLPEQAERMLRGHNKETLDIFQTYARTFVQQHLRDTPDNVLPFTKRRIAPRHNEKVDLTASNLSILPATTLRSPFAALSGFTDNFDSIHELCETVRGGVFLEEEAIPYIPIYPDETDGVPFNAYLLDFFKHGDMQALVRYNGIKDGDVWFRLKDFSLVLATIVTSLGNFISSTDAASADLAMMDLQDAGDILDEKAYVDEADGNLSSACATDAASTTPMVPKKTAKTAKKKKVVDSWEDEDDGDEASVEGGGSLGGTPPTTNESDTSASWDEDGGKGLAKVYLAFKLLQQEFDEKFRKEWA